MSVTVEEYLDVMLEAYPLEEVRENFEPDLNELQEIFQRILGSRDRIDDACQTKFRVAKPSGGTIIPGYFRSILAPSEWTDYSRRLSKLSKTLNSRLAG